MGSNFEKKKLAIKMGGGAGDSQTNLSFLQAVVFYDVSLYTESYNTVFFLWSASHA